MPVDLLDEQDEMRANMYDIVLWQRKWSEYRLGTRLHWHRHRLARTERSNIPTLSGIYTLVIQPGIANHPMSSYLMYVGQAVSLRDRFDDYLTNEARETGRPKIFRLLNKYPDHLWFCYSRVTRSNLTPVENALIVAYMPYANDQLPVEIRRVGRAF